MLYTAICLPVEYKIKAVLCLLLAIVFMFKIFAVGLGYTEIFNKSQSEVADTIFK